MIHPIKPYHLTIRINKCLKCLRHDHTTKICSRPRLCPKCADEHSLEHGCPNQERCVNCNGNHISGHSACAVVQEKRRGLVELSKRQRAELLVVADRQQHQFGCEEREFPVISKDMPIHLYSSVQSQQMNVSQRTYAQVIQKQQLDHDEFSSRQSSQLCEIEKKINESSIRHGEIVFPSIQDIGHILSQSSTNRTSQESFKKFNEKN
ncbi:unnamed protein product [Rotaria magnacalcarata]|uniref:Nucleic-acid-binding protein from mobile element jockey n=2 Tax=Rotaria magnacalcarata TaxID=392030 RepID=A0A8S2MTZ4_9BILA|nr:unnamed protein product [Rotaria magnacalcarata]CAF5112476.1 unnamed protein product [Rotaria magnacalcarata]